MTAPRVAIVGYGRIAPKHVEALRAAGAEVVAACNRSEAGRQRARDGGIGQTFDRIAALVESCRPDAIVCTASFFEIFAAARELIPYGTPLLLEKPPGTSLAEHAELQELAARHRTPVMVGVNRRHYSVLRKALVDGGGLAEITHVDVDWSEDPAHLLARGFSEAQVTKMIFGNSLHGLDLLTFLAGRIAEPQISVRKGERPFDWTMALQGRSERGATVSFRSTWASPGRWRLQFCTSGRRYVFAPLETCSVQQSGVKDDRVIAPDESDTRCKAGFLSQAHALLEMIRTRTSPSELSLAAVRPAMQLAERLTEALT